MNIQKPLRAFALVLLGTLPAGAADFSDPSWPCIQRKVERLSIGLMWQHPIPEDPAAAALSADAAALADSLSLRRVDPEDLRPRVEAFAARHGNGADVMGRVFRHSFDSLSKRRTRIVAGIGELSSSQIALAGQIDETRLELDRQMALDSPDFDRVDILEERLDWDQVIYTDRQKSIAYLCETPQIIERRLFAIGQLLETFVDEPQ
ncbi:hypothetical protein C8N32_101255 [Rhodovulum imhoffii]|uniref:Uncharacterized protein n=1 Tax=Rhodovulum imhoffii TaxID=365340 RepID=A0A2T5BWM3_9RHOB|nr:hypothetical protein [Rhodovulum imhoffii]MBK5933299.1 hypothetical protein [Rhodovulum imhoffii]PTN04057.1 hypothetical protein C8N32_101255 [Rhodovulum imhoffii]